MQKNNLVSLTEELKKRINKKSSKLSEQRQSSLKKQIARESIRLGVRITTVDEEDKKINMSTASNLLTQALILAEDDPATARRLLNVARRLSRK